MNKEYKIKLDLNKKIYNKKMTFNQFDENVNDFYIEVTKNNKVIKDLDKSIVTLVAIKPDNAVEAQFVEVENGLVYADLKPSMCDLVGNYQAKAMIVLEGKIITTDTIIYSVNEDKIISRLNEDVISDERFTLFTDALARLSDIEISEEQRVINEAERILSEENRKIEEAKRVEAELIRQHEEADRAKYDATRESNENIRKINEEARISSENVRLENEANRIEQEANRVKAEQLRKDNYNLMTEDEERRRSEANAHKEAENLRVQAETNRVNEEAKRRTTEQARVSAENTRVGNENTRKANEVTRQTNETQRVEAETQRQNRYNSFILEAEANANNFENYTNSAKVKEEERKSNELNRKSQEDRRVSNEVERISNENTRKANENARIESEKQRVDAENLRKEKIAEIQSDYDSLKKVIIDENASANLQNQINQTNSQLEHKVNLFDIKESDKEFRQGIVTFMCDDGQVTDYTRFYEKVFKPMATPCSICLVTSRIGNDAKYLTWEQARELKEAGWTVCSHTHNHEYCNQLSNSDLEATLLNSKKLLKKNKLDYEYFVIPYGESNNNVINYARKHYKAIVHTGGRFTDGSSDTSGSARKKYVDNYYLYRRSTGEYGRTLAEMKADVDYALANGIWLIFIAHSWNEFYSTDDGLQQLRDLIDYIKNYKGANIVNFEDGLKIKGNVINKGNRYSPEDWYMCTNDGKIFIQSDMSMNERVKNTTTRQSFTPIIKGQNVEGNPTYTTQHGVYKRNMDSIEFSIFLKGTFDDTIDGNVVIGGLPAINKGGLTACNIGLVQKWVKDYIPTGSYIDNDGTDIRLEFTHSSGVHWHIQGENIRGSEFSIVLSGQYFVNLV